ncbi:N-acetylglucosamine-6-phosphate deacetylase [Actinomadura barringtoniae]|uniref:N-acetylglucosamine-6-phosphate deacetylase n=1 Tax=Actinomadura barringtoniae TaxID=1427535 RepID=A0A939P9N4_9ACTN|nr:N-acetylglucosamine-6-phosphate deacetylase [Actinomadura barringtoniae]MBO2448393.1 N-acetylglucosamine-6-phosphate deacetylase [Actinomadura barringtoniae]
MASLLITAKSVINIPVAGGPTRVLSPGYVRAENGVITEVGEGRPDGTPDVDLPDGVLAPGLVDIQVNGFYGHDMVDAGEDGWREVVGRLPETGVTSFLPTFITAPVRVQADALTRLRDLLPGLDGTGTRVLGVHLEGPFLSEKRKGAHNAAHLTDPTPEALATLLETGLVKLVTLAPERDGALDAIRTLTENGVLVSVGHSDATAEQTKLAADAGARKVTHIFNAQSGVDHRNPGVAVQALTDDRLHPGMIVDLVHVAPAVVRLVFQTAPGRVVLVTDAAASAGMPPGTYELGGEPITMPEGGGPPLRADGTLAGSGLRLDEAIANAVGVGIDLVTAIDAATRVPADLIGRTDLGRIAPGAAADLVWLGDDLRAHATWINGQNVFRGGS